MRKILTPLLLSLLVGCANDGADTDREPLAPMESEQAAPVAENPPEPTVADPTSPVALRQQGNESFAQGDYDQAIQHYSAALATQGRRQDLLQSRRRLHVKG